MTDPGTLPPAPHTVEKSESPSAINAKRVRLVVCLIAAVVLAGVAFFDTDASKSSNYVDCCVTQLPYILAIAIIALFKDRAWLAFFGGVAFTTGVTSVLFLLPLIALTAMSNGFPPRHDTIPFVAYIALLPVDVFIAVAAFRLRPLNIAAFIIGVVLAFFYLAASGAFLTLFPGLG
jgi:hypothetical protein